MAKAIDSQQITPTQKQMILRPYEAEIVDAIGSHPDRSILLESPTGSGKTTIVAVALQLALSKDFTHALILAPQVQIEDGFVECSGMEAIWPEEPGYRRTKSVFIPSEFIRSPRGNAARLSRQIAEYLRTPKPGYVFACTYAAAAVCLRNLPIADLPDNFGSMILAVDEAHHLGADTLSGFADLWESRGGRIIGSTATPYRGDGLPVLRPGMLRIRRTLQQHAQEGFSPKNILNGLVPIGRTGDKVTAAEFRGECMGKGKNRHYDLTKAMVSQWEIDGQPKTIIRVPPLAGGSGPVIKQLVAKLRRAGARVYDASGVGLERQAAFLAMLREDRDKSFATSEWDIIVGVQRVLEGTDWPVCSAVYCVGIPGSLTSVVQLLGRTLRKKSAGHPDRQKARITFFVPTAGGTALETLPLEHSRHALLTCVFLADHEIGAEWVIALEVRKGARKKALVAPEESIPDLDPEVVAQVKLFMAEAIDDKESVTIAELMDAARLAMPEVDEAVIQTVALEVLAVESGDLGEQVRRSIRRFSEQQAKIRPRVPTCMRELVAQVVAEFRSETLTEAKGIRAIGSQVHIMTCGRIGAIAQRLREAQGRPLTKELIAEWALQWKTINGVWPNQYSGKIQGTAHETWSAINFALKSGGRGLPGASSLAKLLFDTFAKKIRGKSTPLTEDLIATWIAAWKDANGSWPTGRSGVIPGTDDETWCAIDQALQVGNRTLRGGSSLSRFLIERFSVINQTNSTRYTEDMIADLIAAWHQANNSWPNGRSGEIPGTNGWKWNALDVALKTGGRGLPGGSSLAEFLFKRFGVCGRVGVRHVTEKLIYSWIENHKMSTGVWPSQRSGVVQGCSGITWNALDRLLSKGSKNLPGGSSLSRFISDHFDSSAKQNSRGKYKRKKNT